MEEIDQKIKNIFNEFDEIDKQVLTSKKPQQEKKQNQKAGRVPSSGSARLKKEKNKTKGISDTQAAMLATAGVSLAAGALTTTIARGYTSSWLKAVALGLFGTFLTMFFMTPQMVFGGMSKKNISKTSDAATIARGDVSKSMSVLEKHVNPSKVVLFKQS